MFGLAQSGGIINQTAVRLLAEERERELRSAALWREAERATGRRVTGGVFGQVRSTGSALASSVVGRFRGPIVDSCPPRSASEAA